MYKYFGCIFPLSLNQSTDIAAHYIRGLKSLERWEKKQSKVSEHWHQVATIRWSDCNIIYLSWVARIEKKCCAFETDPVAFPASFPRQLYLMFLPQQPLLDTQEASLPHCPRTVEGGPGAALLALSYHHHDYHYHYHDHYHHLVGGGMNTLGLVILRDRGSETHPVVIRYLEQENMSVEVQRSDKLGCCLIILCLVPLTVYMDENLINFGLEYKFEISITSNTFQVAISQHLTIFPNL